MEPIEVWAFGVRLTKSQRRRVCRHGRAYHAMLVARGSREPCEAVPHPTLPLAVGPRSRLRFDIALYRDFGRVARRCYP